MPPTAPATSPPTVTMAASAQTNAAELAGGGAERGGDGERAASFVEAEPEGEPGRGGGEGEGEAELDPGEPAEIDGGEAGSDDAPAGDRCR